MTLSAPSKTSVVCRVEGWSEVLPDLETLFPLHWKEIALNQDFIKQDMDYGAYALAEQQGMLLVITARSEERLIGYLVSFLRSHFHYKSAGVMAMSDIYYVLPEFRNGTGLKLFREWERVLRSRGIVQAITSCKNHQDHTEFLERLGFEWTDKTFMKVLR